MLRRRVGVVGTARLAVGIWRQERRGEPFAGLPPATTEADVGSRAQAGPTVLLYRALLAKVHDAEALSITAEVIEAISIEFLTDAVGPLRRSELAGLDDLGRAAFVADRGALVPAATVRWDHIGADAVRFTVTACHLVDLVRQVGHPELAPTFCTGDARFFGSGQPDVVLSRTQTIADGAPSCPFDLRWRKPLPTEDP